MVARRDTWIAGAVAVGVTFGARVAIAREPEFRFSWVRRGDATECVDQLAVEEAVRARLARDPFDRAAQATIEGAIEREGRGFRAELSVRDEHGVLVGHRVLDSVEETCAPLGEAVSLAVALIIDPNASIGPVPAALPPAPRGPVAPAPVLPVPPPVCPAPPPCPLATPCPRCDAPPPSGMHAEVVARGVASVGILPKVAPGVALAGAVGRDSFVLTLGMLWLPDVETADTTFAFGLVAASVGGCYAGGLSRSVALRGCVDVAVGATRAVLRDQTELRPVDTGEHPWVAPEIGPDLSLSLAAVRLELGARLAVPVVTKNYVIPGERKIFEASAVGGFGFVGVGFGGP